MKLILRDCDDTGTAILMARAAFSAQRQRIDEDVLFISFENGQEFFVRFNKSSLSVKEITQ